MQESVFGPELRIQSNSFVMGKNRLSSMLVTPTWRERFVDFWMIGCGLWDRMLPFGELDLYLEHWSKTKDYSQIIKHLSSLFANEFWLNEHILDHSNKLRIQFYHIFRLISSSDIFQQSSKRNEIKTSLHCIQCAKRFVLFKMGHFELQVILRCSGTRLLNGSSEENAQEWER